MKTFTKKALATILSLCFILSVVTTTAFALPEFESRFEGIDIPGDYAVTAIVVFEDPSLSEMGYTPADIQAGKADKALSKIQQKQAKFADELNGKGDVCYKYTSVINGAAVDTTYSQLKEIEKINGVKKVYIANTYEVPDVEQGNAYITGAFELVEQTGYNGDGVTIAVLDTGTHTTHEAFQDYGLIKEPAISKEDVDAFEGYADPKYISVKIPFAYDYADGDDDVTDINPATSGHGTHCAGIALGYAERDGEAYFTGTAPAAQLVAMKIFKDDVATTNSGIYFAALDDCYTLGVDIVSMSIGADYGFTYDDELEDEVFGDIYKTLDDAGIIVCVSAGNSGNQSESSQNWLAVRGATGYVLTSYTDYGTVSTPATYMGNIGVAAIENVSIVTTGIKAADGTPIPIFDNAGTGKKLFDVFGNDGSSKPEIAFIDGYGEPKDYEGIDVTGKVVFVSRGSTTFSEKEDAAYKAGAAAIVVYNNTTGYISMSIDSYDIPAVSTTLDAAMHIKKLFDDGETYIIIEETAATVENETAYQVSDFSSWGPTPDLRQVPQIAGVGGYVYSASYTGNTDYVLMSGTSMACPNAAGMFALMLDAFREQYPEMSKYDMSKLAENKAISTAAPTTDAYGDISPVVQQGAGIFQPKDAIYANYYFIDPISDGVKNVSAEGVYTFDITVARTHGEGAESFDLIPYIMTDYPAAQNWGSTAKPNYHFYNTFSSIGLAQGEDQDYIFDVDTESGKVEFADGETEVTVSVTITLSDGAKEFIETYFENGIYIYGYVFLATEDDEVAPHATFLGYYGEFDAAPAVEFDFTSFEMVDIDNFLNSSADEAGNTWADYGYEYYDVVESELGYTLIASYGEYSQMGLLWHLGGSVFTSVPYDASHNAISSVMSRTGDYFADCFVVQPIVYRNLRHLVMEVYADGYGDEPVYVDDTEYVRKSSLDGNYATFQWGGELYDEDGFIYDYVASGTKATVKFYAQLDYEGAELKQVYEFDVLVDYDAPDFIYHYDAETRTIEYEVSDISGIQYFEFYDADLTTLYSVDLSDRENGEVITGEFVVPAGYDIIGYSVMDFATNYTESSFSTKKDSTNKTYKITTSNVYGEDGYTIEPQSNCGYDIDDNDVLVLEQVENSYFMFTIDVMDGYTVTDDFKVVVDGTELTADDDGVYSFLVTKDVTIEVEGIADITAPEISIYDPNDYSAIEPDEGKDAIVASGSFVFAVDSYDAGTDVVESGFAFSDTEYDYSTDEAIAELIDALDWNTEDYIDVYSQYGIGYIYAYAIDGAGNIAVTSVKVFNDTKAPTFSALITEHGTKAIVSITDEMSDIAAVSVMGIDSDYVTTEHSEGASVVTISGLPNGTYAITVIAEDAQGNKSEFKFTLEVEYVPELISDDLYLVGLHETQTVADLKAKYFGSIAVYDKNGNEMADTDRVTTGCTIEYCGSTITIIVKGDLNRDGKVTIADATLVKRSIMGYVTLDDQQLLAGAVAGSGTVTIRDYTLIKRHIQGFVSIYGE